MGEVRKGCQPPTESVVLPYMDSVGPAAALMYQESGGKILERQEKLQSAHKRSLIVLTVYC